MNQSNCDKWRLDEIVEQLAAIRARIEELEAATSPQPPPLDEPTEPGTVVVDEEGWQWTREHGDDGAPWMLGTEARPWAAVHAVDILVHGRPARWGEL